MASFARLQFRRLIVSALCKLRGDARAAGRLLTSSLRNSPIYEQWRNYSGMDVRNLVCRRISTSSLQRCNLAADLSIVELAGSSVGLLRICCASSTALPSLV